MEGPLFRHEKTRRKTTYSSSTRRARRTRTAYPLLQMELERTRQIIRRRLSELFGLSFVIILLFSLLSPLEQQKRWQLGVGVSALAPLPPLAINHHQKRRISLPTKRRISLPTTLHQVAVSSSSSSSASATQTKRNNNNNNNNGKRRQAIKTTKRNKPNHKNNKNQEIRQLFRRAKNLEKQGQWKRAATVLRDILQRDPSDAHSYLALAKLEARRGNVTHALETFDKGTQACPESIHLWQAWAVLQENCATNAMEIQQARRLFEQALQLDPYNPYVCHAYGLYEKKLGFTKEARQLWERALQKHSTAALVCSLGEWFLAQYRQGQGQQQSLTADDEKKNAASSSQLHSDSLEQAKNLYVTHIPRLKTKRETVEVFLAYAWLEERYLDNPQHAHELLETALEMDPASGLAQVALARLEGRLMMASTAAKRTTRKTLEIDSQNDDKSKDGSQSSNTTAISETSSPSPGSSQQVVLQRLANACKEDRLPRNENKSGTGTITKGENTNHNQYEKPMGHRKRRYHKDGRVYNAWANIEVKARRYRKARKILREGLELHPKDFSLLQAAGKVEELMGNHSAARALYSESLWIQPSAPTLVAYALLELRHPEPPNQQNQQRQRHRNKSRTKQRGKTNFAKVRGLFEEALLLDPRHGPAYNSYGNAELKRGNVTAARAIFERGVQANCSDVASVYHGYAKLELALGRVQDARDLLHRGREQVYWQNVGMDSPHRERSSFLFHTLGMLELNYHNNAAEARRVFLQGLELLHAGNTSLSSSQLWLGAALSEVKLGNPEAAREYFELSVQANERHAQAWQAWGVMEMRAGNFATAQTLFQCGLQRCGGQVATTEASENDSSNNKKRPSRTPAPISNAQRARTVGALWLAYATLEGRRGNVAESRTLFAKGLQAAPNHTPLLQAWASLELRAGNIPASRILITQALTRDKHNGSGWLVAAEIERRAGNLGLVQLILRRGIECCCKDVSVSSMRTTTTSDCVELYRALGDSLRQDGKIESAREIYERGLELDPQHAPLYHSLAELEAQVFNLEGLAKLNKRATKFFKADALDRGVPSTSEASSPSQKNKGTSSIWGTSASSSRTKVTRQVAALAQRIVEEDEEDDDNRQGDWRRKRRGRWFGKNKRNMGASTGLDQVDPDKFIEQLSTSDSTSLVEDLLLGSDGDSNTHQESSASNDQDISQSS